MATFQTQKYDQVFKAVKIATTILSGTVKISNIGVVRRINIYKNLMDELLGSTLSDSSGNFSIEVSGGGGDRFLAICLGENEDENTTVFDFVNLL